MSAEIDFVKMSGAGNDFLVLGPEAVSGLPSDVSRWVQRVCRRGLSVGADGVLFVEPAPAGRVRVRFHNPDGSEAFCGNGSRCAARFATRRGWADDTMTLSTVIGDVPAQLIGARVRLTLAAPLRGVPLTCRLAQDDVSGERIDAGVPHFVIFVDDVGLAPLAAWGPALRRHPAFGPHGVNVDVVHVEADGGRLQLRTWERGVEGETLACGSGAIAAAAALRERSRSTRFRVVPASGVELLVGFETAPDGVERTTLEGDARWIFEGRLAADAVVGF